MKLVNLVFIMKVGEKVEKLKWQKYLYVVAVKNINKFNNTNIFKSLVAYNRHKYHRDIFDDKRRFLKQGKYI